MTDLADVLSQQFKIEIAPLDEGAALSVQLLQAAVTYAIDYPLVRYSQVLPSLGSN